MPNPGLLIMNVKEFNSLPQTTQLLLPLVKRIAANYKFRFPAAFVLVLFFSTFSLKLLQKEIKVIFGGETDRQSNSKQI